MKGCLTLVVGAIVLAIIIGAASSGSSPTTTTSGTVTSVPPKPAVKVVSHSDPMRHCDPNVTGSTHTSCAFAENVFRAYADALTPGSESGPETVEATSPVTGKTYTVTCPVAEGVSVTCSGGTGAKVSFPVWAAREYHQPVPSSTSPGKAGNSEDSEGEEDEVGSPSHATDEKFCEENECEGSFETEPGTIVECSDGSYSHAGGISGACSDHGGEKE